MGIFFFRVITSSRIRSKPMFGSSTPAQSKIQPRKVAGYPCFVLARHFFNVGICIEIDNIYKKKLHEIIYLSGF